jgi:hypothetical protein
MNMRITKHIVRLNWCSKRRIEVISKRTASMTAIAVCLAILAVPPANAQSPLGSTFQDQNPTEPHHFRIYQMMKDMTQEMTKMTEQMSQGALTPDQQKQMAIRMQSMSAIMHRLSGLEARPAIKHGDMDKQLDQMQKQMDQMMRD